MEQIQKKIKKKTLFGWVSLVVSLVFPPVGALIGLILAIIILTKKGHDHIVPKITLVFAGAILLIFLALRIFI